MLNFEGKFNKYSKLMTTQLLMTEREKESQIQLISKMLYVNMIWNQYIFFKEKL